MRCIPVGWFLVLAGLAALLMSFVYDEEVFAGAGPRLAAVCVTIVGAAIILLGGRRGVR